MKTMLLSVAVLLPFLFYAQEKGISPISAEGTKSTGTTYAVVVGISDYQDEDIPDLRFADKDALAFAGFLQSPAGGSLGEDYLKVLVNEEATQAQFGAALDWLWEVASENDRVIIYFSGHGDVERKSITQPGYLLCWDAPSNVYMGGGAFNIRDLNDVVSTISIQNKAKVILVTDACRAGKLSGSGIGGAQATAANLAKQYGNEIKILSCQPDEYSIEGEQWGGGRGAFSYHLLDGLYGMADRNADQSVNLMEIRGYLEEKVSMEVEPHNQLPMTIGSGREKLTDVFPDILAQLKEGKNRHLQLFTETESRGIEDDVLAPIAIGADTQIVEMYYAFKKSLEDKQFLFAEAGRAENDYADFYYKKLIAEPSLERLHSAMRRNYAAALQDDAQQVMNDWMKAGEDQMLETETDGMQDRLPKKVFTEKVRAFPACLERAAELLGKDHYMYATLQARKHFFKGYLLSNSDRNPNKELGDKALAQFRQALEWQPELPQAYWQMTNVYGYNLRQPDSAEVYARKAIGLYPSWVTPYTQLAFLFSSKYQAFDRAKPYLEQAMQIDASSVSVINGWGNYYSDKKEYDKAEDYYKKAIQLDSTDGVYYNNLGLVFRDTRRYKEAEKYLKKAIQLDSTHEFFYENLGDVYRQTHHYTEAEKYLKKAIQLDSTHIRSSIILGLVYVDTRRYDEAEKCFFKVIQLDSNNVSAYNNLGLIYSDTRRYDEAEKYLKNAIQIDSTYTLAYNNLGVVYKDKRRYAEAEKYLKNAIQIDSTFTEAYNKLGFVYLKTRRYAEAEKYFKKTIQLDSTYALAYYNLGVVYNKSRRYAEAEKYFKKTIQLDSTISFVYNDLGVIYINTQRDEEAKKYFEKAIQLDSTNALTYNNLGVVYKNNRRYEEAEKYFNKAIQLDSVRWTPYANLGVQYQSSQRWEESAVMAQKAITLGPPIGELVAVLGNAYTHLPGRLEEAKKTLDKGLEMSPNNPDAFIYLAQWSLKMNQAEQAWQYLEEALVKGYNDYEELHSESDFSEMRKDDRWKALMEKYFPEQHKD